MQEQCKPEQWDTQKAAMAMSEQLAALPEAEQRDALAFLVAATISAQGHTEDEVEALLDRFYHKVDAYLDSMTAPAPR